MIVLSILDNKGSDSEVVHNEKTYYPRSFKPGLEIALIEAFDSFLLHDVLSMQLKTSIVREACDFDHLVEVSPETRIFLDRGRKYSFDGFRRLNDVHPAFLRSLSLVANLLTWHFASAQERFRRGKLPSVSRVCVLCGETQVRDRNALKPNTIDKDLGWPLGCFNPDCLSHKIEKTINPGYQKPTDNQKHAVPERITLGHVLDEVMLRPSGKRLHRT